MLTIHAVISSQIQNFLHPESQTQEFPVSLNSPILLQFNNDEIAHIPCTCATIFKAMRDFSVVNTGRLANNPRPDDGQPQISS